MDDFGKVVIESDKRALLRYYFAIKSIELEANFEVVIPTISNSNGKKIKKAETFGSDFLEYLNAIINKKVERVFAFSE